MNTPPKDWMDIEVDIEHTRWGLRSGSLRLVLSPDPARKAGSGDETNLRHGSPRMGNGTGRPPQSLPDSDQS